MEITQEILNKENWTLYKGKDIIGVTEVINENKYLKLIRKDIQWPVECFGLWGEFPLRTYKQIYDVWLSKRPEERGRADEREFLEGIGYHNKYYCPLEIVKITNSKMIHDEYWVDFEEGEIFFGLRIL